MDGIFQINGTVFMEWVEKDLRLVDNKLLKKTAIIGDFMIVNKEENDQDLDDMNMDTYLVARSS